MSSNVSVFKHSIDRFGDRFLHRVFTDGEIEYSMSMKFPERHLAARFAGKEAVAKAFGTGIGKAMGWRNIDIRKKGAVNLFWFLQGRPKRLRQNGVSFRRLSPSATLKIMLSPVLCLRRNARVARAFLSALEETELKNPGFSDN